VPGFGHGIGIVRGGLPDRGSRFLIPGAMTPLLYAARDGALRTATDALDSYAFDLAGAVNTIHRAGYAMDAFQAAFRVPNLLRDLFSVGKLDLQLEKRVLAASNETKKFCSGSLRRWG
jgi:hypothetical protein